MKKIYILSLFAATLFSAVSCNDWLEATSSTQLPADKVFDSKTGFYDAVSGVYILTGQGLYGNAATWQLVDAVCYPYQYNTQDMLFYRAQTHAYAATDVKGSIEGIWTSSYNVVANINLVLRELEAHRDVVPVDVEYRLLRGEMLAMRAMLHFNLMRLFGTADWSGENADKKTVPYVLGYDKEPTAQLSYEKTQELLLSDLMEALDCLKEDPVTGNQPDYFETSCNNEGFWNNRTLHMNYYAAEALAARVYQWLGDCDKAAEYAQDVIDKALGGGTVSWVDAEAILSNPYLEYRDWSFTSEHLFSLEVAGLSALIAYTMMSELSYSYILDSDFVSLLFPRVDPETGSVAGAEDIRGSALQLRFGSRGYRCYKLYGTSGSEYGDRMPMLKISEMYYILAEKHIADGNNAQALAALDAVRAQRAITDRFPSTADAETELMKEYYREFICEGQLFYWLKHKQVQESLNPDFSLVASDLVFPYPEEEINYGRVQEL